MLNPPFNRTGQAHLPMSTDNVSDRGRSRIPRWPGEGIAAYEFPVPTALTHALSATAAQHRTAVSTLVLAAHVRVLGMLTGERHVLTGCAGTGLPDGWSVAELTVPDGTWAELIRACAQCRPLATDWSAVETLVYRDGDVPTALPDGVVLGVAYTGTTMRYRVDPTVLDAGYIGRVHGYHLAALRALTGDPTEHVEAGSLLSAEEIRHQTHDQDRHRRPLPDRRAHELFADRALAHLTAVAIRYRGSEWTYRELDQRANRVAHMLLDAGVRAEDVVGVLADRTPQWAAAVLGVLKCGGVYLPLEPTYPRERVLSLLRQSGARCLLTDDGSSDQAAVPVRPMTPDPHRWPRVDAPEIPVAASQLAYIYFTSGSTGLPKGVMCEQWGMLNHLLAKVDVLGIGARDVVAQNAPVGFDISLWQLLAALLVGGSVEILPDQDVLDVRRFVDRIVGSGVTVLQLVPSYLDILLDDLETRPQDLDRVRVVSVTGEAIGAQLVNRWFAAFPAIPLVNAYGATEASDDTTHAVLTQPLRSHVVPVGRPIPNVTVYVVDERLRLMPLGAPGEIVFSGRCVGRGYVNDPRRTAESFTDDPVRPGNRLYRTGDFGRWLPSGELGFLGRRDEQVKIRGMRVEIGEVEHRILAIPEVRAVGVVVRSSPAGNSLVAFYVAAPDLTPSRLLSSLRSVLPAQLVPVACHRLAELPLTENGKTDKKKLTGWAHDVGRTSAGAPVATPTEHRVALAWSEVLGHPVHDLSADDDFFALGGDSLGAIRLVVKLDRAVSLADLMRSPVLRDLAAVVDGRGRTRAGLVQPLAEPRPCRAVLVSVPDGGGTALNFRPLAAALAVHGIQVCGVELPGHDIARRQEPLCGPAELARRVVAELVDPDRFPTELPILLWGQGAGSATALEIARLLDAAGRAASSLFVAPPTIDTDPAAQIAAIGRLTDADVKATLASEAGFVEVDDLQAERAEVVGAAYRHDLAESIRHLAAAVAEPRRYRTSAPITVVTGGDDPANDGGPKRVDWRPLGTVVSSVVLPGGGHQFHRTHPDAVARIVLEGMGLGLPTRAGQR